MGIFGKATNWGRGGVLTNWGVTKSNKQINRVHNKHKEA